MRKKLIKIFKNCPEFHNKIIFKCKCKSKIIIKNVQREFLIIRRQLHTDSIYTRDRERKENKYRIYRDYGAL